MILWNIIQSKRILLSIIHYNNDIIKVYRTVILQPKKEKKIHPPNA